MIDPIFVKVRNDQGELYGSYNDYWSVVNLSQFPTCELDEVQPQSDNTYIFSPDNGNVKACCIAPHTAKYILWQLERPGKVENNVPDYCDEMWVSDRYQFSLANDPRCKYVTFGGHADFGGAPQSPKLWDFVVMAYLYGERQARVEALIQAGWYMAPNIYGQDREKTLAQSRWGVALHQDNQPIIEPLRFMLFASWRLPIVADHSVDYFPYKVFELTGFREDLLGSLAESDITAYNYNLVTNTKTLRKCVEDALHE